ncbi:MAG: PP2C family protein-serine/threonine phosphatase [Polyangia bacterium]
MATLRDVPALPSTPTVEDQTRLYEDDEDDAVDVLRRLRELSRISGSLPAIRDEGALLREVVAGLARYFDERCTVRIFVTDADGDASLGYVASSGSRIEPVACAGLDALAPLHRDLFLMPLTLSSEQAGRGTILSAPLIEGTALLGLLLVEGEPSLRLGQYELETLAGVAAQSSMALAHLRSTGRLLESRKMERDFEVARRIQRSFLPQVPERIAKFRIATRYQPAYHVGGDFYDVLPTDDGKLLATIGDVSGKGVSGALLMARVTSELRRISSVEHDPCAILTELDGVLASQIADDTFVTAACALLDAERRTCTVANAGHVIPILRRACGKVESFSQPSGPPLAMDSGQSWADESIQMEHGDILLLMTDGVLDALHTDEDPLGLRSLESLVARMPPDVFDINARILAEVASRTGGIVDDITLVAIELCE